MELHIPAALLTKLAAHPDACGEWAAVVADLAAQHATHRTEDTQVAQGAPKQDPAARFAGAMLRRYIQIRDRVCVHPGCRCPARHADLDHTLDYAYGGITVQRRRAGSGERYRTAVSLDGPITLRVD